MPSRIVVLLAFALVGCRETAAAQQRALDQAARTVALRDLLAVDSAHGRSTSEEGLATGFVRYLAEDAMYLQPGADHLRGKGVIQAFLARQVPGTSLRFHPALGQVSLDGAAGYTVGWTELTPPGDGARVRYGKYVAFWRRQADGGWKIEAWNRSGSQDSAATAPNGVVPTTSRPRGARVVDPAAEARKLMAADSAFAAVSVARGTAEAFYRYAAPDALILGGGRNFIVGRNAIRDAQAADAVPGQLLEWKPVAAGVASLGDLGWTVGEFRFTAPRDDATVTVRGKYLTIWARQPDGSWRFVADGGSATPTPSP